MRQTALLVLSGVAIGALATVFVLPQLSSPGAWQADLLSHHKIEHPVSSDQASLSLADMADMSVVDCFHRPVAYVNTPPVWITEGVQVDTSIPEPAPEAEVSPEDLPGLVKLEQILSEQGSLRSHCAATRISDNWLLTAGHCIQPKGKNVKLHDVILLAAGKDIADSKARIIPVDHAVCHKAWQSETGKFDDDVAMLYVADETHLEGVEIASLDTPENELRLEDYKTSYFAGWGKNGVNRYLRGGALDITLLGEMFILGDNKGGFSPCVGDSGGPLYVRKGEAPIVAGVLSSITREACPPFGQSFYVRVKTFDRWIDRVMRNCVQKGRYVCQSES